MGYRNPCCFMLYQMAFAGGKRIYQMGYSVISVLRRKTIIKNAFLRFSTTYDGYQKMSQ
jgi:hypothetical protein